MIRIGLVEDHAVMREVLLEFLALEDGIEVCWVAGSGEQAICELASVRPDLLLIDMSLPGMSGVELIRRLRTEAPELRCAILSGHREPGYVTQALDAGASGYVLKGDPDDLSRAIVTIAGGERYVSEMLGTSPP